MFTLIMVAFLCKVRNNTDIEGICVGGINHKVATYIDDLLFFITKPATSLPCLFQEFKEVGVCSFYKSNWSKSEPALPVATTIPPFLKGTRDIYATIAQLSEGHI